MSELAAPHGDEQNYDVDTGNKRKAGRPPSVGAMHAVTLADTGGRWTKHCPDERAGRPKAVGR